MIETGFVKPISISRDCLVYVGTIHERSNLCECQMGTTGQTGEWIVYEAKVHVTPRTCGRDFLEQLGIKRHRIEKQHAEITQTRHQGIVATEKQRYAKPSVTLKRKPITVRASHGINSFHTKSFIGVLSIYQDEIHYAALARFFVQSERHLVCWAGLVSRG